MWSNIKYYFWNIYTSFGNFYRYFSVIKKDRQFDFVFIFYILKLKLELTSATMKAYPRFETTKRSTEKIDLCIRLLDKLIDDYYSMESSTYADSIIEFVPTDDCEGCSKIEVTQLWENYDSYFKKHKSTYNRIVNNFNGGLPSKVSISVLVGVDRERKAKELLFNTLRDNITSWWI
jgi:hypothetical protein